jgi:hypothetical protein
MVMGFPQSKSTTLLELGLNFLNTNDDIPFHLSAEV